MKWTQKIAHAEHFRDLRNQKKISTWIKRETLSKPIERIKIESPKIEYHKKKKLHFFMSYFTHRKFN